MNLQFNILICGNISSGKSTLVNGILRNNFNRMSKIKSTLIPIKYIFNDKHAIHTTDFIQKQNEESHDKIKILLESNQFTKTNYEELSYNMNHLDFLSKPMDNIINYIFNFTELPGLDDAYLGDYHMEYLENNIINYDVILYLIDIHNYASHELDYKNIEHIYNLQKNKNLNLKIIVLVNKCNFDKVDDRTLIYDEEECETFNEIKKRLEKLIGVGIRCFNTQQFYIYSLLLYNIDSLDEKQIDNIIKEECGKSGLSDLKTLKQKKDFLKGLIQDKKKKLPEAWMKCTGYDLFQKYIKKIILNYKQIIAYHIEQDIDKILADTKKSNNNFDETTNNLEIINQRFRNLIATYNDKCKVEEIISQSIKTKLDDIAQCINNYLVAGINTYSGNTRENAESFIAKISKFFTKVSNLFKTNPLTSSEEKLKIKRIELINNNLVEKYNPEDFIELYTTKTIDLTKYTQSIANTLDKKYMTFDKLLESVKKITNNDEKFMNVIINKFTSSYKQDTTFDEFLINLELIANVTNNNLDIMWSVIECQLKAINNATFNQVYHYWINLNSVNILQETDEIKYMMFKIDNYIVKAMSSNYERFDTFKQHMNNIQNMYNLLTKLVGKKTTNIIDIDFNEVQIKTKKDKLIDMTDDEFLDATDGEKTETEVELESEKSDTYNDSDDPTTVYQKTMRNAKVRTTRKVNKGAKVTKVSK